MKKIALLTITLLYAIIINAQSKNQNGYIILRGGLSFKDGSAKGIASISVGMAKNKTVGIGAGIGYISFDKPYIPLTVDISYFGKPGKVSPVIIGQAGYGVYNYSSAYVVGRGGFTGSINAGVGLPIKSKSKFILTAGYYTYGFSTTTNVYAGNNAKKINSTENRIAVTFGFKF